MPTQQAIDNFLAQKTLALAGASRSGKKFGNTILKELRAKGYEILPVHPAASTLDGLPCFPSLAALPKEVGGLILVVSPAEAAKLVQEAAAAGIMRIWMQQGSESPEALQFCQAHNITVIHGECILMFAQPAAVIHRCHRWLRGLFGRLPPTAP